MKMGNRVGQSLFPHWFPPNQVVFSNKYILFVVDQYEKCLIHAAILS